MKKLKILVFEYITGGGLNKADLPEPLAKEGLLMLETLLGCLARIGTVEVIVMMDVRIGGNFVPIAHNVHVIGSGQDCQQAFIQLAQACDAVWPIAPESGAILQILCGEVERTGKILLTSSSKAVAIAGDKWLTYKLLRQHSIATVPTQKLADFRFSSGEWMLKPVDGVGCEGSYLLANQHEFEAVTAELDKEKYLVQPHIAGEKTSLSCLFKEGLGWLLCANRQHFSLSNKQYQLAGITVNFILDSSRYQALVNDVAKAMPDLWGYVGIDLIETADEILVLEINPRLTTSYAGIYAALGINCAAAVLDLLESEPRLQPVRNHPIFINLTEQASHAS